MDGVDLLPLDDMLARCERVLAASPADATAVAWLEVGRGVAETGRGRGEAPPAAGERTVLVRVEERGRTGFHRTGAGEVGELENAVRCALALARSAPASSEAAPPTPGGAGTAAERGGGEPAAAPPGSFDDALARLAPGDALRLIESGLERGEAGRLAWGQAHAVVASSDGLRRRAGVTAATFAVRSGRGPGAGRAAGSARALAALGAEAIRDRARARRAEEVAAAGEVAALLAAGPPAVVLAPEAVAGLLALLGRHALSARSLRDGVSPLAGTAGRRLFDPALDLRDDGTDPCGLPFPFDLGGALRRPVELVTAGTVAAAAADPGPPTAAGGDDGLREHLFLAPGALDDAALLAAAAAAAATGEALWIADLDRLECWDPPTLRFRARARGVRRVVGGALGPALGELIWEDSLLRLLATVAGVGARPAVLAAAGGALGAVSAPALALPAAEGLRPAG